MNHRSPPSGETSASLLERLRDGSAPLAWDEFFQRYWPVIYAFARHRGCSEHTAEEIVQEVMLKVFRQRDVFQYDPRRGRFRDWLGMVARHQVAEYRRRPEQRTKPAGGQPGGDACEPPADTPGADEAWESAFENSLLLALLDVVRRQSNPRDYLAFELYALKDMKAAEVARVTGLAPRAVYRVYRKLLDRLRRLAGHYGDDGTLGPRLKEALQLQPGPAVQRSLTRRIEATMRAG